MEFELVVSQGSVSDKPLLNIPGAAHTANAVRKSYGIVPIAVRTAATVTEEDAAITLLQASDALRVTMTESVAR